MGCEVWMNCYIILGKAKAFSRARGAVRECVYAVYKRCIASLCRFRCCCLFFASNALRVAACIDSRHSPADFRFPSIDTRKMKMKWQHPRIWILTCSKSIECLRSRLLRRTFRSHCIFCFFPSWKRLDSTSEWRSEAIHLFWRGEALKKWFRAFISIETKMMSSADKVLCATRRWDVSFNREQWKNSQLPRQHRRSPRTSV